MALGGVFMTDTDGNIGYSGQTSNEQITGLLFDISKQSTFFNSGAGAAAKAKLQGTVVEINSMDDLKELGITPFTGSPEADLLFGIPYYHIKHFFDIQGASGRLYVAFADCKSNWDVIDQMQHFAHGMISQLGVWTEQSLWYDNADEQPYALKLVNDLNVKALALAEENSPLSIILSANSAIVGKSETDSKQVDLSRIPSCILKSRYVSVLLGQAIDPEVQKMHYANKTVATPVGCIGAALGTLAIRSVHESLAWVEQCNLIGLIPEIEMGFGDMTDKSSAFTSTTKYSTLNKVQIDALDDKGYIFLCKYPGLENGVFFSKDHTCSDGDYRTIARNRTINKSRRLIRRALLPYVNSPLRVDPATGNLSPAKISHFQNLVSDLLRAMQNNGEISGFGVTIDPNQNVLKSDTLIIKYNIVPVGVASRIEVVEGLALTNSTGGK